MRITMSITFPAGMATDLEGNEFPMAKCPKCGMPSQRRIVQTNLTPREQWRCRTENCIVDLFDALGRVLTRRRKAA